MYKVFKKVDKVSQTVTKASLWAIIVIGLFMLALCLVSVILRYFLHNSLTWGEEILKISLVWFGLLSVGVIAYRREHVGIVIFKEKMPAKVQTAFGVISQVLLLFASIMMTIIGAQLVMRSGSQLTPALRRPYAVGYMAIPVAFGIMVVYEIRNTLLEFTKLLGQYPEEEAENEAQRQLEEHSAE